ncbi:MAG TPA: hypothetical protein VE987_21790 [Polyangiaceae bacterium]|nr:hypothetical protein [Polyangiaceae bacterium]
MRVELEGEALVVGMALVPALLSRNRSFALFENPTVRRARRRAALVRGIVRQLSGAHGQVESLRVARGVDGCELSYRLPGMKMQRRAELSDMELACVRYLAARSGVADLQPSEDDRASIDAALRRLADGLKLASIDADVNA